MEIYFTNLLVNVLNYDSKAFIIIAKDVKDYKDGIGIKILYDGIRELIKLYNSM